MAIHMATLLNFDVGETEKVRFLNSSTHCIKAIFNFLLSKLHHIKLFFLKNMPRFDKIIVSFQLCQLVPSSVTVHVEF
jgi:hypothetical protein